MTQKRILLTGAAGFIGYHTALALQKRGDLVFGIDNFNPYYSPQIKESRHNLLKEADIPVLRGEINNRSLLEELVKTHKITHILHLAAQAGVRYSLENPSAYVESNIQGFLSILELCRAFPHLKLTYASSSSVYGNNTKTPFSETDLTENQASFYGVTKKSNELMAAAYHRLFKIPVTGLRFFTVYGPWGRPDMAYYSFVEAILQKKPINLFNNGEMLRDFTYIDDIVAGTIAALDLEAPLEIFNLGNNRPVKLLRFVEIIEEALGLKAEKQFLPMQQGDVPATYADIDHAKQLLNFSPITPLEVGIPRFVEWYRKFRESPP